MVLVVSLIILVIVTLLAVSAMRVTMLEERMAGNTRDRQLAFESTEYALREAQNFLSAPVLPGFTPSGGTDGGLLSTDINTVREDAYWTSRNWKTDFIAATKASGKLPGQLQPRYAIEEYQAIPCKSDSLKWPPPQPRNVYRVTAGGTGRTTDSEVVLQIWYDRGCSN